MPTRAQIIKMMLREEPRIVFRSMQLGGNTRQLNSMEADGLITSEARYGGRHRQRNWFLSEEQWHRHHNADHDKSEIGNAPKRQAPQDSPPGPL